MSITRRVVIAFAATGALLAAGCTAGDSAEDPAADTTGGGTVTPSTVLTGPSPGVTDDAVKVGVTYVDLESIAEVVNISHGDYEGSYQALFDAINDAGGINGRTVEPVIVGINPTVTQSADEACVQLTEDEDVFIVVGFFLNESVTCVIDTHETAAIGGSIDPQVQSQVNVPWFSTGASGASIDFQLDVLQAMADAGELEGTLGVFAGEGEEQLLNDEVLPALDDAGIEVAESAVVDAPSDDITAVNAAVGTIAERFQSAGVDRVVVLGTAGVAWASGVEPTDYRPQLLLTDLDAIGAYAADAAGRDLSILDGAVGGAIYGPAQSQWELPSMQECIGTIQDGGVDVDEPSSFPPGASEANFTAPFNACRDIALLQALLDAAGEDLNYGTLAAGAEGLEVDLPVQPEPMVFGSGSAADGDPTAYLFDWDPDGIEFVPREN